MLFSKVFCTIALDCPFLLSYYFPPNANGLDGWQGMFLGIALETKSFQIYYISMLPLFPIGPYTFKYCAGSIPGMGNLLLLTNFNLKFCNFCELCIFLTLNNRVFTFFYAPKAYLYFT